jgi:AcrR family transcriptional regulator
MSTAERAGRRYSSPLREGQAKQTREIILDALVELLGEYPADQVLTKQIAERAGVSQPTVYRHFPDRVALVEGLAGRIERDLVSVLGAGTPTSIEEWADRAEAAYRSTDEHVAGATADAVLNADPRRVSAHRRQRSEALNNAVARSLPGLDADSQRQFAALVRTLDSVQTWFRMRVEFGLDGATSGKLVGWAVKTLLHEARNGMMPGPGVDETRSSPGNRETSPRLKNRAPGSTQRVSSRETLSKPRRR